MDEDIQLIIDGCPDLKELFIQFEVVFYRTGEITDRSVEQIPIRLRKLRVLKIEFAREITWGKQIKIRTEILNFIRSPRMRIY